MFFEKIHRRLKKYDSRYGRRFVNLKTIICIVFLIPSSLFYVVYQYERDLFTQRAVNKIKSSKKSIDNVFSKDYVAFLVDKNSCSMLSEKLDSIVELDLWGGIFKHDGKSDLKKVTEIGKGDFDLKKFNKPINYVSKGIVLVRQDYRHNEKLFYSVVVASKIDYLKNASWNFKSGKVDISVNVFHANILLSILYNTLLYSFLFYFIILILFLILILVFMDEENHDLTNILPVIASFARSQSLDIKTKKSLQVISYLGGYLPFSRKKYNLNDILIGLCNLFSEHQCVNIGLDLGDNYVQISGKKSLRDICRAFQNILDNAVKFCPENKDLSSQNEFIKISLTKAVDGFRVVVWNYVEDVNFFEKTGFGIGKNSIARSCKKLGWSASFRRSDRVFFSMIEIPNSSLWSKDI